MAEKMKKRFEQVYVQSSFTESTEIWQDRETGVNYLFHTSSGTTGGGLTPLLDREGKPVITLVENK